MESLFALVGTVVFTSKTLYWVAGIGYISTSVFCFLSAYFLTETTDFGT